MHEKDSIFDQMISRGHERLCFHQDPETGLKAIVAIHSTALGNALGGTRRWYYGSEADAIYDVLRLSKGMTYKAAVSGLPMGGAKSVIMMPHRGEPHGLVWVAYDENGEGAVVRDQGGFHNGVHPARGNPLTVAANAR